MISVDFKSRMVYEEITKETRNDKVYPINKSQLFRDLHINNEKMDYIVQKVMPKVFHGLSADERNLFMEKYERSKKKIKVVKDLINLFYTSDELSQKNRDIMKTIFLLGDKPGWENAYDNRVVGHDVPAEEFFNTVEMWTGRNYMSAYKKAVHSYKNMKVSDVLGLMRDPDQGVVANGGFCLKKEIAAPSERMPEIQKEMAPGQNRGEKWSFMGMLWKSKEEEKTERSIAA